MPATLREVSEKLNLSPGLVSRVLNNRPGVRATPDTIERIRRYASELNYEPSAAAKSLRVGKTSVVGFISSELSEEHESIVRGQASEALAGRLHAMDYSLLVKIVNTQRDGGETLKMMVRQRVCDAIALWGDEQAVELNGKLLEELGMPFVVKGRLEKEHRNWLQVDYDHEGMMLACVRFLAERGHERIGFIGFDPTRSFQFRLIEGYRQAMRDLRGSEPPPSWVMSVAPGIEAAEVAVLAMLDWPPDERLTALVVGASNNPMWGIERALARHGKRIGYGDGDFAVAGMMNPGSQLLFGQAYGYAEADIRPLAKAQADQLQKLFAGEKSQSPIVRILPELKPLRSLCLGEVARNEAFP
jgi:LacI family transcriptional regulator